MRKMSDKQSTFCIQTLQALLCTALISFFYCNVNVLPFLLLIVVTLANYSPDKVVYYDELLFHISVICKKTL